MYIDTQTRLASAQAFTATAATTNTIDFRLDRDVGRGEALAMVFTVTTAADITTGDETYSFAIQTDDNSAFSSATTLVTKTVAAALLTVGDRVVIPFPPTNEQHVRGYATLGGTTPTVSCDCDILPLDGARTDHDVSYASGFTVA